MDTVVAQAFLTPTEHKMLQILGDKESHGVDELHGCLFDDMSALSAVQPHITHLRQKLRRSGYTIICERHENATRYRLLKPS